MHPILFLDIDDVLCLNDRYGGYDALDALAQRHSDPQAVFRGVFSAPACRTLHQVHCALDGNLRYVISSSWRKWFKLPQLLQVFQAGGLGFVAERLHQAWCTPDVIYPGLRATDIAMWIAMWGRGEPFAIVDDTYSWGPLEPTLIGPGHPLHGRVVLCDERVGLLPGHVEPLLRAMRQPLVSPPAPMGSACNAGSPQGAFPWPGCGFATRYAGSHGGESARS